MPQSKDHWTHLRGLALLIGIGLFLAFIQPYNATRSLAFHWAVLYWTMTVMAGGYSAELAMHLYARWRSKAADWETLTLSAVVSALVVSAFIVGIEFGFSDGIPLRYWPMLYFQVLVIATAITLIGYTVSRAFGADSPAPAEIHDPAQTFLERLPIKYRSAELWAISSEDHYLRVHTSIGDELILMRLADAVRELASADGRQTHRSWWVAKCGIAETRRENGRLILKLKSGTEAPVSRSFQSEVRAAGFV